MSTLAQIRQALAKQISTIPGLVAATYVQGSPNPPVAVVLPATGDALDYTVTMPGSDDVIDAHMRVVLAVGTVADQAATELLDGYLNPGGPQSVRAAIEADPTLGGVVDFAVATGAGRYMMLDWAGAEYLSAEVYVDIGGSPS